MSKITDYTDRSNAILWGDGAGAVVLSASDQQGILSTHIHADGQYEELLHVPKRNVGIKFNKQLKCKEVRYLKLQLIH